MLAAAPVIAPLVPKAGVFLGMTGFQWLTVGLSALGLGLQAGAGQQQPRVTEQERQIRRNNTRWNQIRNQRISDQARSGGAQLVNLLNIDFDTIDDDRKKLARGQGGTG